MTDAQTPDPPAAPVAVAGELHRQTRAIRSGRRGDGTSLAPVLWPTSTFVTPTIDDARRMATTVGADRFYTRYGNPTVAGFEDAIADLEGAEAARATTAAIACRQEPGHAVCLCEALRSTPLLRLTKMPHGR